MRSHIVLHHSFTKDGTTVSWSAIERYHREVKGWDDIGYHAGIELVDDPVRAGVYAYQALYGRREDMPAAACKEGNMNARALHLCFVGNFDLAEPHPSMLLVAVRRVIRPWMDRYGIPVAHIMGHHDFASYKSCPGNHFPMDKLRRMCA